MISENSQIIYIYLICNSGQVRGVGRADEDNDCGYCPDERYSTNIAGDAPAISYTILVPSGTLHL